MATLILLVLLCSCSHTIAEDETEEDLSPASSSEEIGQILQDNPDLGSGSPDSTNDTAGVHSTSTSSSFLPINCESRNISSSEVSEHTSSHCTNDKH